MLFSVDCYVNFHSEKYLFFVLKVFQWILLFNSYFEFEKYPRCSFSFQQIVAKIFRNRYELVHVKFIYLKLLT